MQIRDLMTRRLETIAPSDTLKTAAERMQALGVGALPVREGDTISGIITDRDIAVRAVAANKNPEETRVAEAMTPRVIDCHEDDRPVDVAERMAIEQVRRLLVRDRSGEVVGIVSVDDLAASGEPIGLGPNRMGTLPRRLRRRRLWRLALAPLALWGIADSVWLIAAPRRWAFFWTKTVARMTGRVAGLNLRGRGRRRPAQVGIGVFRASVSASILAWTLRPLATSR